MNVADSESRPVLGPAGNKSQKSVGGRKPLTKPLRNVEKSRNEVEALADRKSRLPPSTDIVPLTNSLHSVSIPSILRKQEHLLHMNLSLDVSCSSDASSESFRSRASTGRIYRTNRTTIRRRQLALKSKISAPDGLSEPLPDSLQSKKRCAWVTPNADANYAAFHDEEWGLPVHDDKKLFELLVFSGALAELTWPAILCKRHTFREVFADFDPVAVAKFNEKKITASGSTASSLLSELKLRAVIENARQISKVLLMLGHR
ncbi:uncharacterized protein LOC127806847 isoform X2 [Diospyros lotus]|uniref:uncharacterized protein LOC127806847 isoform X2 n=1 Tax=Diospyros lotus TaxID=55363 RepID=UPI00224FDC5C|nr:uncharacterized protein LOC127806847 isoform X2 [Diospyros lotus]